MGKEGFESYASVGNIRKCKLSYKALDNTKIII